MAVQKRLQITKSAGTAPTSKPLQIKFPSRSSAALYYAIVEVGWLADHRTLNQKNHPPARRVVAVQKQHYQLEQL